MTSNNDNLELLAELSGLLDAWGGDPVRWPARVRQRIAVLAATGPGARRLLDEAKALDRLLDRAGEAPAPLPPPAASALTDRIVARALASERPVGSAAPMQPANAKVIPLPTRPRLAAAPRLSNRWHAPGLIAASLLAGLYFGGSVNLAPVLQELAEVAGLSTVVDPSLAGADDLADEETL